MAYEPKFIHLRVKTEYSLLEGAVRVDELAALCRKFKMPAVGVCDHNNLFGALHISETLGAEAIQHIVGIQLDIVTQRPDFEKKTNSSTLEKQEIDGSLLFFAQNETGYKNLLWLASQAYENSTGKAHIFMQDIVHHNAGIICLTGGSKGLLEKIFQKWGQEVAYAFVEKLHSIFPKRLYVELQRYPQIDGTQNAKRKFFEKSFIELAFEKELPLVATNDVHFVDPDKYNAHDALLCIADGTFIDQSEPRRRLTREHYFKSAEDMATIFADLPEALANSVEIAKRCAFHVPTHKPILPKFADNEKKMLIKQAHEGLKIRLDKENLAKDRQHYIDRLDYELGVIVEKGYTGYFLIVADFIQWARGKNIPVGPGRGSGAGSLVAYALTITDIDPLCFGLYFERFLNPGRPSMPDFDIDFCMDRRDEVIRYVCQKYGDDKVAQIITFGALLSKMAVRDIGRVLQIPYNQVDRIAKMIPVQANKPVSIKQALSSEPRLKEEVEKGENIALLMEYSQQVEGLLRNASTHAAGVVIGDRPLSELVPLYRDQRGDLPATQFSMKWAEKAGLVKFDFLGLKTLTVLERARKLLVMRGVNIDISRLPLDDDKTYKLYNAAHTVGVFQVEGTGMMSALRQLRPTSFDDIIALVALYRPGPLDNIEKFCKVKNGLAKRENLHPLIDHILDETQGFIVYQEQVMRIAQDMANYSLSEADTLRRAMGKKEQAVMASEKMRFFEGARKNKVPEEKIADIWDFLEKFANYGFNKSHAAAYAMVSYQTAWLKAHYPAEFMTALMNCDIHDTDKLSIYIEDTRKSREIGGLGIDIVTPCINRSCAEFSIIDEKIIYGLGALRNVGLGAAQQIEKTRGNQNFTTIFDFTRRADLRIIGKRPLEQLINAGAFDQLDDNRAKLLKSLDKLIAYSALHHDESQSNQVSLFEGTGEDMPEPPLQNVDDFSYEERLDAEFSAVGFYIGGHPLDLLMSVLKKYSVKSYGEVMADFNAKNTDKQYAIVNMAGIITQINQRRSERGTHYAFLSLCDPSGQYEVIIFSDQFEQAREFLTVGEKIFLKVEAQIEDGKPKLRASEVNRIDADMLAQNFSLKICIQSESAIVKVAEILNKYNTTDIQDDAKGKIIFLHLTCPDLPENIDIDLGQKFLVSYEMQAELASIDGVGDVEVL